MPQTDGGVKSQDSPSEREGQEVRTLLQNCIHSAKALFSLLKVVPNELVVLRVRSPDATTVGVYLLHRAKAEFDRHIASLLLLIRDTSIGLTEVCWDDAALLLGRLVALRKDLAAIDEFIWTHEYAKLAKDRPKKKEVAILTVEQRRNANRIINFLVEGLQTSKAQPPHPPPQQPTLVDIVFVTICILAAYVMMWA